MMQPKRYGILALWFATGGAIAASSGALSPDTRPKARPQAPATVTPKRPALAGADFTFRVPVDFRGLYSEVRGIRVICGVQKTGGPEYKKFVNVKPVNGTYRGMVMLQINVTGKPDRNGKVHPGITNADMDKWYCITQLHIGYSHYTPTTATNASPNQRAKPGTVFKYNATGSIPW